MTKIFIGSPTKEAVKDLISFIQNLCAPPLLESSIFKAVSSNYRLTCLNRVGDSDPHLTGPLHATRVSRTLQITILDNVFFPLIFYDSFQQKNCLL